MSFHFKRFLPVLAVLTALPLLAYFSTLNHSFHYDDPAIKKYVDLKNYDALGKVLGDIQNRVVLKHVFAVNHYFAKDVVFSYHLLNTIIHICTSIGVFCCALILLKSSSNSIERRRRFALAFTGAVFFTLSPLATQAVTYIISRSSSLATLFYLLSFLFFFLGRQTSFPRAAFYYPASLFFFYMGLGTKEIAITAPAIAILSLYFFSTGSLFHLLKKNWVFLLALAGLACSYIFYRGSLTVPDAGFMLPPGEEGNQGIRYLITQLNVIPYYYLRLLFFPFNLNLDPDFPHDIPLFSVGTLSGVTIIIALLFTALRFRKHSVLSMMICWFFMALIPTSSIVALSDPAIEHRLYLPSIGFFIVLALLISRLRQKGKQLFLIILLPLLFFSTTLERNRIWMDDYSLWSDVTRKSPHKSKPHNNLGGALFQDKKDFKRAIVEYKKAIHLNPRNLDAQKNLGSTYYEMGMYGEAIRKFEHAYLLSPTSHSFVCGYLGDSYLMTGEMQKAAKYLMEAIGYHPNDPYYYLKLGTVYQNTGDLKKAADTFRTGLEKAPNHLLLQFHLAGIYSIKKEYKRSEKLYLSALKILPVFPEAMMNLGIVYKEMEQYEKALHWMRKLIHLTPNSELGRINFALLHKKMGNLDAAEEQLVRAIALNPANPSAYNILGSIYFLKSDFPRAKQALEKSVELNPQHPQTRHNLEVVKKAETQNREKKQKP